MEKLTPNETAPILNKLNPDDIPRCIDCNLICSLQLNYNDGKPLINFECENNHKGNILLKDYMLKYNKFALSKEKCGICGKNQKEVKGDFIYCTKCKQFLCHSCQLNHKIEDKHNNQPYVNIEDLKYLCGDENPIFIVYYKNINIADKNKIEFSGAFADLSLMNCQVDSEYIRIITDGTISDGDFGFVTLKGGFFEGIDTDIDLYFAVYSVAYHIDCSTLKLENNELSFVALFSNKSFDNIGIDNVNFDPFDISKVEIVGEKKDGLKIYIPFEGTFDEALSKLAFGKIVVDEDLTDNLSGMDISFDINFPTFDLYSELNGKNLIIHFRYHDVITNDIKIDNIQISLVENSLKKFYTF